MQNSNSVFLNEEDLMIVQNTKVDFVHKSFDDLAI
ncbi:hypothetical protein BDGGKGIB_02687 [Nodularia sphaerocarpa UHCC 0038]|nr:hypothetical protein BDGGKGIB_02687 [Nodularia sphaerocarpa UHCC 0038]